MDEFRVFAGADYDVLVSHRTIIMNFLDEKRFTHPDCNHAQREAELTSETFFLYRLFFVGIAVKISKWKARVPQEAAEIMFLGGMKFCENILSCFEEIPSSWKVHSHLTPKPDVISIYLEITCKRYSGDAISWVRNVGGKPRVRDALLQNIEVYFRSDFRSERLDRLMITLAIEAEVDPFLHEMLYVEVGKRTNWIPSSNYDRAILAKEISSNFPYYAFINFLKHTAAYVIIVLIWILLPLPYATYSFWISLIVYTPYIFTTISGVMSLKKVDDNNLPALVENMAKLLDFIHQNDRISLITLDSKIDVLSQNGARFPPQVKLAIQEISRQFHFI